MEVESSEGDEYADELASDNARKLTQMMVEVVDQGTGTTAQIPGIKVAGKTDSESIRTALWKVKLRGVNGDIAFAKEGPAGKESGQNAPNVYVVQLKDGAVTVQ